METRAYALTLLSISALALAMRFGFGPWETLHGNGQGPLWIESLYRDVFDPGAYGPGYRELYGDLAQLSGRQVELAVFAMNGVLSALTATAGVALARALGLRLAMAGLVGVALALDPVAIRISTTEAYLVPIAFGVAVVAWLVARGADALRSGRLLYLVYFVAAGLLATCTARIHQCAWPALAAVPFVAFAGPRRDPQLGTGRRDWRAREPDILAALIASGTIAVLVICFSGPALLVPFQDAKQFASPSRLQILPLGILLPAIAGLIIPRTRNAFLCAAPALMLLYASTYAYRPVPLFEAGYHRLFAPFLVAPAAMLLPQGRRTLAWGSAAAVAVFAFVWPRVAPLPTDAQENRCVRSFLKEMPADCALLYVGAAGPDRRLRLPVYAGRVIGEPLPGRVLSETTTGLPASQGQCRYYYRSSLCSTNDGAPLCARLEAAAKLRPVATWSAPARPSMVGLDYETDPVSVGIFAIE